MSAKPHATRRLVFATRNRGKAAEMARLLAASGWGVDALPEAVPEYEEGGNTFGENARGKALFTTAFVDAPALADDSGLEIEALEGAPGVQSARYVDPSMPQSRRNAAVLERLAGVPAKERTARFVCHLALAHRGVLVHETSAACEGRIPEAPRGEGGFGYDPIFELADLGCTFAELEPEEKAARSHRGAAARAMIEFLRSWTPADDE